jgi:hypothetical protein
VRTRKKPSWQTGEDDPTAGLVNLFDVWMIFAVALLLALVAAGVVRKPAAEAAASAGAAPVRGQTVERIRLSPGRLSGEGERLGVAYRLKSGEIVYIKD